MSNIQTLIIYAQLFGVSPIHIENDMNEHLLVVDIKKKFLDKLIEIKKDYSNLKIEDLHMVYMGTECKDNRYIKECYNYSREREILMNIYPKKSINLYKKK